ncbi:hypothetical protein ACFPU0_11830 [Pseudomonas sp. GCM10022186]|uniref:hypothetical protein n=1 Tax=Pseudomonas sp. GCM10022186 TaxID=3252650 RepID=UPI00362101F7
MKVSKPIWLLQVSLLLYPVVLPAHEPPHTRAGVEKSFLKSTASDKPPPTAKVDTVQLSADHRRAVEAHVRYSDYRILLLLRSATMSNIDSVLDAIDALRRSNQECAQRFDRCRGFDAVPNTADASKALPDAKL